MPVAVPGLPLALSVAAGDENSLAVAEDGSLLGWGSLDLAQVEPEVNGPVLSPAPLGTTACNDGASFEPLTGARLAEGGSRRSIVATSEGLLEWEADEQDFCRSSWLQLRIDGELARLSAAGRRHLVVTSEGTVWYWEDADTGAPAPHPVTLPTGELRVFPPVMSLRSGTYTTELDVMLTAPPGSVIHYTTDDAFPDESSPVVDSRRGDPRRSQHGAPGRRRQAGSSAERRQPRRLRAQGPAAAALASTERLPRAGRGDSQRGHSWSHAARAHRPRAATAGRPGAALRRDDRDHAARATAGRGVSRRVGVDRGGWRLPRGRRDSRHQPSRRRVRRARHGYRHDGDTGRDPPVLVRHHRPGIRDSDRVGRHAAHRSDDDAEGGGVPGGVPGRERYGGGELPLRAAGTHAPRRATARAGGPLLPDRRQRRPGRGRALHDRRQRAHTCARPSAISRCPSTRP